MILNSFAFQFLCVWHSLPKKCIEKSNKVNYFTAYSHAFPLIPYIGSISVMFSRLYLGVHSPADIVAGGIVGCVILACWIKIDNVVDRYIAYGDNGRYLFND